MATILYSVEYRKLTEEIARVQQELIDRFPGDFEPAASVLDQVRKGVEQNWDDLRWYSGSEAINIIANKYAAAISKSTANLDYQQTFDRLLNAVWPRQ